MHTWKNQSDQTLFSTSKRYLAVDQHDLAINMYKKREEYEQMLRLVSKHRHELLADTYKHIAEQYELKGIACNNNIFQAVSNRLNCPVCKSINQPIHLHDEANSNPPTTKGNLKRAEHYYVEAKTWQSGVSMYRQLEKWDDAKRVAKTHGGKAAFEKVVLAQAHTVFKVFQGVNGCISNSL